MQRASLDRAAGFLWSRARLVERRAFERAFMGGTADAVVQAVRAYRNLDGGLGHALEADLRTPTSQPIFVDAGLSIFWEPPGPAAVEEWRGRWTLDALLTLRAYGRL